MNNKYAGFWRRFWASLVDGVILGFIGIGISSTLGTNPFASEVKSNLQVVDKVLTWVISVAYTVMFYVNYEGATPGKKLLAIKVIKTDGQPLNYGVAIIRSLASLVSAIPLFLGYIWVAFDSKKQAWHDKIAGTYVVRTDKNPRIGLAILIIIFGFIGIITMEVLVKHFTPETKTSTQEGTKQVQPVEVSSDRNYQPQKGDEAKILSYAPASCGLSVPVPKTQDTKDGKPRKWVYEELEADANSRADNFIILDSDTYSFANSSVLLSNISYKNPQQIVGKNETSLAYTGINIWCTDNYKNLSLEEFKSLALLNKQLSVTENGGNFKWGDVDVVAVFAAGTLKDGFQLKQPGYIGVTRDGKKLLYMRLWDADLKDPIYDKLSEDIKLITRNLKYR